MSIRTIVNRLLAHRGLEVRERHRHPKRHSATMSLLSDSGFRPGTVIDVGVATGTPWLYERFRDARFVLIEPNPTFAADLARLKSELRADVYTNCVGAKRGEVVLHVDAITPSSSSVLDVSSALSEHWTRAGRTRRITDVSVPILTLDETLSGQPYPTPFLLKIDTEGYERDVVVGAENMLRHTDVVVAEISVARRFEGSYEFSELVMLLEQRGFRLYDLLGVTTFGRSGPINFMDAAFVRRDSSILTGHSRAIGR